MDLSAALAGDLAVLTEAIDDPDLDLQALLDALTSDLRRAVASYLGMRMTIVIEDRQVSFTAGAFNTSTATVTSLLLPLATVATSEARSTLVFYASVPGAFVDLAAHLSVALGIDPSTLILDDEVHPLAQGSIARFPTSPPKSFAPAQPMVRAASKCRRRNGQFRSQVSDDEADRGDRGDCCAAWGARAGRDLPT